jgi:hypothetical protein
MESSALLTPLLLSGSRNGNDALQLSQNEHKFRLRASGPSQGAKGTRQGKCKWPSFVRLRGNSVSLLWNADKVGSILPLPLSQTLLT